MAFIIRDAREADLPTVLAIHNDAVLNGTALWTTQPSDLAGRAAVIAQRRAKGFPYIVAEQDGEVAGYGSFGDFRPHDGYFKTVEHSLYVRPDFQRRGIASGLLERLIDDARALDKHVMVGGITTDNTASIALHARYGFVETGRMPQVGFKFGRYLDLLLMQKILD